MDTKVFVSWIIVFLVKCVPVIVSPDMLPWIPMSRFFASQVFVFHYNRAANPCYICQVSDSSPKAIFAFQKLISTSNINIQRALIICCYSILGIPVDKEKCRYSNPQFSWGATLWIRWVKGFWSLFLKCARPPITSATIKRESQSEQ